MVHYTILKTVFIESLSVFMNISKNQGTVLAIFGTFSRKSSKIDLKDDKTSILFTVSCNISTLHNEKKNHRYAEK